MKANIIKFEKISEKEDIDITNDSFKILNLKCYFEREYYDKIMKICHDENITLSDILNEALGIYISLNYIDPDEHQKHLKEMWENFNNKK